MISTVNHIVFNHIVFAHFEFENYHASTIQFILALLTWQQAITRRQCKLDVTLNAQINHRNIRATSINLLFKHQNSIKLNNGLHCDVLRRRHSTRRLALECDVSLHETDECLSQVRTRAHTDIEPGLTRLRVRAISDARGQLCK